MKFSHNPVKHPILRTRGLATPEGAKFGMTRNNGTRAHQGIDLALDKGFRCYAVENGKIVTTSLEWGGHGMIIMLQMNCPDKPQLHNRFAFYSHLSKINVKIGQEVKAGAIIGLSGDTGNAKGMDTVARGGHLHFEVRTERTPGLGLTGRIDPLPFISNLK
jgi:murein DD-endopeptidase MepM/ murein hydrolase activator NlpD